MKRAVWCVLLLTGLLEMSARSAPAAGARAGAYAACMAKANSTLDMQSCQTTAIAAANTALAAAYAKARAALAPDQAAKLREAQRRWASFRSADCDVFVGSTTGSLATVSAGTCMLEHTRQRIRDLQALVNSTKP